MSTGAVSFRGVIRYQQEHEPWSIYFQPQGLGASPPPWLNSWRGDGILARINDRRIARALSSTSVPIVDLRNALPDLNLPTVAISNCTVVRLAVDHFLEHGFRRFAFCGTPRGENRNQDDRCALFEGLVKDKGFRCPTYEHPVFRKATGTTPQWSIAAKDLITSCWTAFQVQPAFPREPVTPRILNRNAATTFLKLV